MRRRYTCQQKRNCGISLRSTGDRAIRTPNLSEDSAFERNEGSCSHQVIRHLRPARHALCFCRAYVGSWHSRGYDGLLLCCSGGKDSCYNSMLCARHGHEVVALGNLCPALDSTDELDSYMYQTVGHQVVTAYAVCAGLPLFRRRLTGSTKQQVSMSPRWQIGRGHNSV